MWPPSRRHWPDRARSPGCAGSDRHCPASPASSCCSAAATSRITAGTSCRANVDDPIIAAAQSVQRQLVQTVERPGPVWIVVLFGLVLTGVLAAGATAARRRNRTPDPAQPEGETLADQR